MQRRRDAQDRVRIDGEAMDISELPSFGFGHRSILWWATQGLMAIEGTVFALAIATYFYLRSQSKLWPPTEQPPDLLWGTLNTAILLISLWPNHVAKRAAEQLNRGLARKALAICMLSSIAFLVVRVFEFASLNCRWDGSAYGSIVWTLLSLHTLHLLTDTYDSGVLLVLSFTGPFEGKRFVDVSENALYWYFVVYSWLPIYAVIYWAPRVIS
ncbi:MAG: cytochrome C oxidase subunit III [Rubrivivax sp.]|nr:MAG: cytochrome C oxidase subunit III [Rubrivivax sp.]